MVFSQPSDEMTLRPVDRMSIDDLFLLGGYPEGDPLADVLQLLFSALEAGKISIDLTPGKVVINSSAGQRVEERPAVDRFLTGCRQGVYDAVVARAPEIDKPLILAEGDGSDRLYFQKYYYHESRLKRQIEAFRSAPATAVMEDSEALMATLYEPERSLRTGSARSPLAKDQQQVLAIGNALTKPLSIISGGPGTGKTTVVTNLLRALAHGGIAPEKMLLAAPTGRAAQRLGETVTTLLRSITAPTPTDIALQNLRGLTLHAALGYSLAGQFRYSFRNPMLKEVVIVDEASMVDIILMSQFFSALDPRTTRLVLLGDPDQLPAVAAGSFFSRLATANQKSGHAAACRVVLEKGYRSGSELTHLAQQIRQGDFPDHQPETVRNAFSGKLSRSWCRLAPFRLKEWPTVLENWAHFYCKRLGSQYKKALNHLRRESVAAFWQPDQSLLKVSAELLESITAARILTVVRRGPWGCEDINAFLKPLLATAMDQEGHPGDGLFAGMTVMISRNDHRNKLYNGDVGIVVALKEGYHAIFPAADRYVALPVDQLVAWEPAMATTVHKSQGSEYREVFFVLPDDPGHRLLSREMIYTAVSRARERLLIWGDPKVLQRAVTQTVNR